MKIKNNRGDLVTSATIYGSITILMIARALIWGGDGVGKPVKNCIGTHVNGNCNHLELTDFEKQRYIERQNRELVMSEIIDVD